MSNHLHSGANLQGLLRTARKLGIRIRPIPGGPEIELSHPAVPWVRPRTSSTRKDASRAASGFVRAVALASVAS